MDTDNNIASGNPKTPIFIKVIKGLLIFRLSFFLLLIILFWCIKDIDSSTRTALAGIKAGVIDRLGGIEVGEDSNYILGRLIGFLFFPGIFTLLLFFSVKEKRFIASIIFISLDLLFGFSQGLPIISIIILVLLLLKSSKDYLKRTTKHVNTE